MTETSREDLLRRVFSTSTEDKHLASPFATRFDWEDIAPVIEGLAMAGRPLSQATSAVTRRHDLGPRGCYILSLIARGISYPLDLASVLRIGRSLVTAELNRLTAAGLITSTPGTSDRRRSALSLTSDGMQAATEVRDELQRIICDNLASYSADDIRLFARMLADASKGQG